MTAQLGEGRPVLATTTVCRLLLLRAVERQGGEWTPGRVKRLFAQNGLTHVYRATIRRHLRALCAEGLLERHETPGRRWYTPIIGGDE